MDLNNIIFTSVDNVPYGNIGAINVLQNFNNHSNGIILIQNTIDDDQLLSSDSNENIHIIENVNVSDQLIADGGQKAETYLKEVQLMIELSKVCRCCLNECANMQDIFDDDHCLPEMIMSIAPVQVLPNDGFPSHICVNCVSQISRTISFRQQIEAADSSLRDYVAQGFMNGMKLTPVFAEIVDHMNWQPSTDIDNRKQCQEQLIPPNEPQSANETASGEAFDDSHPVQVDKATDTNEIIEFLISDVDTIEVNAQSLMTACIDMTPVNIPIDCTANPIIQMPMAIASVDSIESSKNDLVVDLAKAEITTYKCNLCKKLFTDLRRLNRHKKIHLEEKPYNCNTCDKGFNERSDLTRHMSRHVRTNADENGKEYSFKCKDCGTGFKYKQDLDVHSSIHTKAKVFSCNKCRKIFSTIIQLKRHVRIHFKDKPHKCPVCNKGFAEMGSRTRHFRRHTGEQREKKFLCMICGKKYSDSHSLSVHIRSHTGEKPWKCDICERTFSDSRLLNSHSKVHSNDKPYACSLCNRRFTHQSTLTTHLRTHTGEKPYVCTVCGKTFIQSSNLCLHMRVHSGEKPYKCKICGRKFSSSSSLTIHNRIHTGERPYKCPTCDKRFARHDLSAHLRTHTGEKPYACTIKTCTKRFTTSGQLTQHLRAHDGLKPYVCDICNQACSSLSYLKKHIDLHKTRGMPLPLDAMNAAGSDAATSTAHIISLDTGDNIEIIEAEELRDLDIIPKDDEYIVLTIPRVNDDANAQFFNFK